MPGIRLSEEQKQLLEALESKVKAHVSFYRIGWPAVAQVVVLFAARVLVKEQVTKKAAYEALRVSMDGAFDPEVHAKMNENVRVAVEAQLSK